MASGTEKQSELLLEHYEDTFRLILYHYRVRNRLFIFIFILLALSTMLLHWSNPDFLRELGNAYIASNLNQPVNVDWGFLNSILWSVLMYLLVQYNQN